MSDADFRAGDSAFILNSFRNRAHLASVIAVDDHFVTVRDVDRDGGPLMFLRSSGLATGDYEHRAGAVPAKLVPHDDPEALAIRAVTEPERRGTLHYDEIVECAANFKRDPVQRRFDLLLAAVESWGDDLGMDW